jgi:hypothetical protein
MSSYLQQLERLPHRDLRGIATRLGLRRRGQHQKAAWTQAIAVCWQDPARQAAALLMLSEAARAALSRLQTAGELPAGLFLAQYGPVRHARPDQPWTPPPWEVPATISEELYYAGLLLPAEDAPLARAGRLTSPAGLRLALPLPAAAAAASLPGPWLLLHDVGQLLAYLHSCSDLTLQRGGWLSPVHLSSLNRRLWRAEPDPLPPSHKRTHWLRFIFFLATAADLQAAGRLTPLAWDWLADSTARQLDRLWQAWQTAAPALRRSYGQPGASLPPPWPQPLLAQLAQATGPFTAGQLADRLLGDEAALQPYFMAHLPDLASLDAVIADALADLHAHLGLLQPTLPQLDTPAALAHYQVTPVGAWLLGQAPAAALPDFWTSGPATLMVTAPPLEQAGLAPPGALPVVWRLACPLTTRPWLHASLAPYARHEGLQPRPGLPEHLYHLDETTVAPAAATGHGLPTLLAALTGLGLVLSPQQLGQLHAWHAQGHAVRVTTLAVLRAATPQLMARIVQTPAVAAGLGEQLSSTVAVLADPPAELIRRLRAAGFFPQAAGIRGQEAGDREQESGDRGQESKDRQPAASFPLLTSSFQSPTFNFQLPAFWLTGQLYALLGQHLTLPVPPPFEALHALLAALSPVQQAVLQSQWESLRDDLLTLLDGQAFTPPPQPADPDRWRPLIAQAIAEARSLQITYFTAGRNVLTQRTVTPYWIEEHRGIPYLRADCHLAGKVLLFRLDRIMGLVDW